MSEASTFWSAFLDGFTMRGFSEKLSIPGVPTRMFAEPDGPVDFDRYYSENVSSTIEATPEDDVPGARSQSRAPGVRPRREGN
jgi:hypothetical protein